MLIEAGGASHSLLRRPGIMNQDDSTATVPQIRWSVSLLHSFSSTIHHKNDPGDQAGSTQHLYHHSASWSGWCWKWQRTLCKNNGASHHLHVGLCSGQQVDHSILPSAQSYCKLHPRMEERPSLKSEVARGGMKNRALFLQLQFLVFL